MNDTPERLVWGCPHCRRKKLRRSISPSSQSPLSSVPFSHPHRTRSAVQFYSFRPENNKTRVLTRAPSVVKLFRLQKPEQSGKRLKAGKRWVERDLVFSDETGNFLSHRVIYRCFKELVKEIGTSSTRFHDLSKIPLENI